MANKPLLNPLPADLPENWQINQIVAPTGAEVGLAEQYGYNYLMAQLNAAQQAINNINEAFPGLAGLVDGVLPVSQGGTGNNSGYVRVGQKPNTYIGSRSTIEGFLNEVSGDNAHAEGLHNLASGDYTHVEGLATTANGENSHAEGGETLLQKRGILMLKVLILQQPENVLTLRVMVLLQVILPVTSVVNLTN